MGNPNENKNIPAKDLTIFYVLDTSGSMGDREALGGTKISVLNNAMRETIQALKDTAASIRSDAHLRFAVMEFNSNPSWVTCNGPENVEDFADWIDLKANGGTYVGSALNELDSKLSKHAWMKGGMGQFLPIIIFMTDGGALDDYSAALAHIKTNLWFARATKIGFALGAKADRNMVADVVGSSEAVLAPDSLSEFSKMIRLVSVTASMINGVSRPNGDAVGASGAKIVDIIAGNTPMPEPTPAPVTPSVPPVEPDPNDGWS